jgi:hypothetical protein
MRFSDMVAAQVVRAVIVGALAVPALADGPPLSAQSNASRLVLVSAVDKNNVPARELAVSDLEIKVGGKVQKVLGIRPATGPMRIAVLVSDGGTGAFQRGLTQFVQLLYGRAEFQFVSMLPQPEKLGPYAGDRNSLVPLLNRLGTRAGARPGAQLIEAIMDATQDIKVEAARPVIVVARLGGETPSDISAKSVRAELRRSGAILYVLSVQGANRRPARSVEASSADTATRAIGQSYDTEATDQSMNLQLILGDGARESGGRHDEVASITLANAFDSIAAELLGQYEVMYSVPDNYKPTDRFVVSSARKGLTVRAPSR